MESRKATSGWRLRAQLCEPVQNQRMPLPEDNPSEHCRPQFPSLLPQGCGVTGVNEKRQFYGSEPGTGCAPSQDTGRQCNAGHSGAGGALSRGNPLFCALIDSHDPPGEIRPRGPGLVLARSLALAKRSPLQIFWLWCVVSQWPVPLSGSFDPGNLPNQIIWAASLSL